VNVTASGAAVRVRRRTEFHWELRHRLVYRTRGRPAAGTSASALLTPPRPGRRAPRFAVFGGASSPCPCCSGYYSHFVGAFSRGPASLSLQLQNGLSLAVLHTPLASFVERVRRTSPQLITNGIPWLSVTAVERVDAPRIYRVGELTGLRGSIYGQLGAGQRAGAANTPWQSRCSSRSRRRPLSGPSRKHCLHPCRGAGGKTSGSSCSIWIQLPRSHSRSTSGTRVGNPWRLSLGADRIPVARSSIPFPWVDREPSSPTYSSNALASARPTRWLTAAIGGNCSLWPFQIAGQPARRRRPDHDRARQAFLVGPFRQYNRASRPGWQSPIPARAVPPCVGDLFAIRGRLTSSRGTTLSRLTDICRSLCRQRGVREW